MQVSARISSPGFVKRRMNQYFRPEERRYCFHAQVLRRCVITSRGSWNFAENFFNHGTRSDAAELRLRFDAQAMRNYGNGEFLDVIGRDETASVVERESLRNFH